VRPTKDVDVVVEVTSRSAFHEFEARLRQRGFAEDQQDGMICCWRHSATGLILDAMPADPTILGFANRWQGAGLPHAIQQTLPSGATIRAMSPPYLLATKLEAFKGRGQDDFVASPDFEDIVALLDGRDELVGEVRDADSDVRAYLADEFERLIEHPPFRDGLFGALRADPASQGRAEATVLPRVLEILRAR
jgi:hypothetical protein